MGTVRPPLLWLLGPPAQLRSGRVLSIGLRAGNRPIYLPTAVKFLDFLPSPDTSCNCS